jgi:methyl-accepting chemotaxis protein
MKSAGGYTDAGKNAFVDAIRAARFGAASENNYAFGYHFDGVNFAHINPKRIGADELHSSDAVLAQSVKESIEIARSPAGNGYHLYQAARSPGGAFVAKVSLVQAVPELDGLVGIGLWIDDIDAMIWARTETTGLVFLGLLALCGGIAFVIHKSITTPIGVLTGNMSRLADGDLGVEIVDTDAKTEIGALARALGVFRQNAVERADALQRERAEDARRAARVRKIDDLNKGFDAHVGQLLANVEAAVERFQSASSDLSSTAEETNARVASVAAASEQSSANVRSAAAATEELTASVEAIGGQVRHSSTIAARAVGEARATNDQIAGLAQATSRIGEVVNLIASIASQTNLLALNATIEAARAGDAGRGFAVVATEVKSLATQTGRATEEIATQVAAIQLETAQAVGAIQAIAATIESIDEIAASIAQSVEEQKLATGEIAGNTSVAASGTNEVAANIGKVADAAFRTETTARDLSQAAGDLRSDAQMLRRAVQGFLAEVKAA